MQTMRAAVRAQLETRKNSQREWIGARCQPFRAIEYLARREEKTDVTPGRAAGRLVPLGASAARQGARATMYRRPSYREVSDPCDKPDRLHRLRASTRPLLLR